MKRSHRISHTRRWLSAFGHRPAGTGGFTRILFLMVMLFGLGQTPSSSQAVTERYVSEYESSPLQDPYFAAKAREAARKEQEKFRTRIAIPDAIGDAGPPRAAIEAAQKLKRAPRPEAAPFSRQWLLFTGIFALSGFLLGRGWFPEVVEQLKGWFAPWDALRGGTDLGSSEVRVEGQAFAAFAASFHNGPGSRPDDAPALPPVEKFLVNWPGRLANLRKQLQQAAQATDSHIRRQVLCDLGRELQSVKGEAGLPELMPVWQMICVLEGLVRQLADKVNDVTPSTLRTVGGSLDLLAELCQPGLDSQLLTRCPVRLLAVDDDAISRNAVSFALKRALHAPDLAAEADSALVLAEKQAYDVIFLDVQMPGMDGFELCTQIRKTALNPATPVVFVTGRSDFGARVQSTLIGGCDLIAKPFLSFELAAKALTLTMKGRLGRSKAAKLTPEPAPAVARADEPKAEVSSVTPAPAAVAVAVPLERLETDAFALPSITSLADRAPAAASDTGEIADKFLTRATEHLGWVDEMMQSALQTTDKSAWLPILSDVYLRLNSFTPDQKFARRHPAMLLGSTLEKLLRKLLQNPTPPSKATMLTVTSAAERLRELCATATPQCRANASLNLLVVDDDPIARRALTGALQTMFQKPVCAENGEMALALAAERTFDAIFLDVQMPGMDGNEVFARLRSEGRNIETPVVFVCGRIAPGTMAEINARGNSDILAKPFLPAELLVKTLTLMLRRQSEQSVSVS